MRLWHILGGIMVSIGLVGCADKSDSGVAPDVRGPIPASGSYLPGIAQPSVTGTVNIRQKIALPADAVLTVTVSDASLADAPSKIITQRVTLTNGKQSPFHFVLPYNPSDIQPNARVLLSAAVAINHRVTLITESVVPVINNGVRSADLTLVPVESVPVPANPSVPLAAGTDVHSGATVPPVGGTTVTPIQ